MSLWSSWWKAVQSLRPAFSRERTFFWFIIVVAGYSIRHDIGGVTSIMRCFPLHDFCYDRLLDFFHSNSCNLSILTQLWANWLVSNLPGLIRVNNRLILVADGVKIGKEGRKMPARKALHQESASNTKPSFIMGHSCQVLALLAGGINNPLAVPIVARIHEGLISSCRNKLTLIDHLLSCLLHLALEQPCYVVADAFYACGKMALHLKENDHHLISRVKSNAVAFQIPPSASTKKKRGQPKKYGTKVYLSSVFCETKLFTTAPSPVYQEKIQEILFYSQDLIWRSAGCLVRFVWVIHPNRGRIILLSTDLSLDPLDIIKLYGWRFKIEVAFKQTIHTIGTFDYHFWMKDMIPTRKGDKSQFLPNKNQNYRDQVWRKMDAFHLHIQCGIIVHGLLQFLSIAYSSLVWSLSNSWLRTKRLDVYPSEAVTKDALRNSVHQLLGFCKLLPKMKLFLQRIINPKRRCNVHLNA